MLIELSKSLPETESSIPQIKTDAHYLGGDTNILVLDTYNYGNAAVPRTLLQAVVVCGEFPATTFFSCKMRAVYKIPEDGYVTETSLHIGTESGKDMLVMNIEYDSPSEGQGRHIHCLCELPK